MPIGFRRQGRRETLQKMAEQFTRRSQCVFPLDHSAEIQHPAQVRSILRPKPIGLNSNYEEPHQSLCTDHDQSMRRPRSASHVSTLAAAAIHPVARPFRRGVQTALYIRFRMRNGDCSRNLRRRFLDRAAQIAIANTRPGNSRAPDLAHR
jgi:hypothetical protein